MMETVALAVSSCLTHLATNLDNLVVMLGLALTMGRFQVIAGYMLAQVLVPIGLGLYVILNTATDAVL